MKRERPPMPPVAICAIVAERQFLAMNPSVGEIYALLKKDWSTTRRLQWMLSRIFEDGENVTPHALDHDPALILRPYNSRIRDVAARYTPHAHSADHLIYRAKDEHQQKTTGRRPGAERTITTKGSDIGIKTKFARLERGPRRKAKIPSHPFPKRAKR